MMKTVCIVGTGTGAQSLTFEGLDAIKNADVLIGAPRMIDSFAHLGKASVAAYKPAKVRKEVMESEESRFAVLVSGDTGFFSGAAAIYEALGGFDTRLIPGVSCVSALSARLGIPWQSFKLASMHGANANIVDMVRRNRHVLCLTGGNAAEIGQRLETFGFGGLKVYAGENLGCKGERISKMAAKDLSKSEFSPLTVLLIVNDDFEGRVRFGIPDGKFARIEGIPMTKSEIRAIALSKLGISPGYTCYDIGAGTGSVTVEAALAAYGGRVFAIESDEKALPLIRENLIRFHAGNVTAVHGKAPDILEDLPPPEAAFIGGSSGEIGEIIAALVRKNAKVRIVATAIAPESAVKAIAALETAFDNAEMIQISVSGAKRAGGLHMMIGQNPITVLSGGGI